MSVKKTKKEPQIDIKIEKEAPNKYNESFEKTLGNIHAIAIFSVKNFGRLGYIIKKLEEVVDELKKANKGK
jgi:hypothetical protein